MNLNSKEGTAGITALLVIAIVVAVNFLVGGLGLGNLRVDLTQDKLYTLTQGSKNILERLNPDKPVTIRYYVTTEDRVMPPMLKSHASTVQDLLLEFQKASQGKLILEKLAPNPNTEDEDRAREDDLQGMTVNQNGDNIYLGMAIQSAAQKEVLPFLSPNEENALEYNIARAIQKVSKNTKTVIGVMSAMPVMGSPMFPYQRQAGQDPWIVIQRLRMDYEVRDIPISADKIDSDISTLVVIHPADISEISEYAIDQYLLKGGKVIALVDPQSIVAQRVYSNQQNPMTGQPGGVINPSSDLANLFKAWGVNYNKSLVVADVNYRGMAQGGQNPVELQLPREALSKDESITSSLQSLRMLMAGSFSIDAKEGITADTLFSSSEASEMIDTTEAEKLIREKMTNFNPSGRRQIMGVRLSGRFKTAFPGGRPKGPAGSAETGGAQDDATAPNAAPAADAPAPAAATPEAATATEAAAPVAPQTEAPATEAPKAESPKKPIEITDGTIKESVNTEGVVILFSDADMMFDALCVEQDRVTGGLVAANSNLPLMLNAIEALSGGGDLLKVRSRASIQRPFIKMDELREKVEKDYRPKLQALQAKLDETAQKMGPLRVKNGQLADPRQIKELNELMRTQSDINREIREVKKTQNKEIDFTESMITLLNFLVVPLLVISVGLLLAIRRRVSTAAV
ncbi:GldG family protein [Prosthecobacter sp. SYSU 5D2]|uniref:GldG family protein n=1 Tax=Prosthecobacter sp. SYSU 5D2 TaxID=3134134 RepID=UPI0031FEED35